MRYASLLEPNSAGRCRIADLTPSAALPWTADQLHIVENYWEAAGIIAAVRAGISPGFVRRPLPRTVAVKKTLRAGTTTPATPAVS